MSLATRCPVCQTVFRVVQDQLKVSEGWVRCGRCAKVFNAFEGLFDLEREFPALRSPTPSQRVLEDLATRNRNPKPPSQWQDDLDTSAATRAVASPAQPADSTPAPTTFTTVPAATVRGIGTAASSAAAVQRSAAPGAPPPAPMTPGRPAAAPQQPAPAASADTSVPAASFKDSAPFSAPAARSPVQPRSDDGATIPPVAAIAKPASQPALRATPAVTAQPATPQQPAVRGARPEAELAIREEPGPVPGTATEADAAADEQSFEALFRSDGELAQPAAEAAADDGGIDILLDGADVEPASLDPDDAVDSRLLTFVQQADRAERWRRPGVRMALVAAALALTALLAAQLLVVQRDLVVAQWPAMRSLVQSLCEPLNCRIEPLRRIDQLGVDSSGLTRIDDGPIYRLVLVLRNRGETPLLMPSIDISLTDAAGALVARRMLSAADLGSVRTTIAAGQELPLQALLMSTDRPLTGYTIEIFYP